MAQAQQDLSQMQEQYNEASERLKTAEQQVAQAEAARDQLQQDVKDLEDATKRLRQGLVAIREGNVAFRSGEILYSGVLKGGDGPEATKLALEKFLGEANTQVAGRIGVQPETQVIWLSREAVDSAASTLSQHKGNMYVRLCAAGNILSGEMVVSRLEMVGDKVVYPEGTLILTQAITVKPYSSEADLALMAFLKDVNRTAQADGVIPNPITGRRRHYQHGAVGSQREDFPAGRPGFHYGQSPPGHYGGRSGSLGSGCKKYRSRPIMSGKKAYLALTPVGIRPGPPWF